MKKPPRILLTEQNLRTRPEGFLSIKTSDVTFHYPNGEKSQPFPTDRVVRKVDDAVVIIAWYWDDDGPYVYLRSSIRPALALRDYELSGLPENKEIGNLWELPAGCLEPEEVGGHGLEEAAAREAKEEIGFDIDPDSFDPVGFRIFPAVGMSGERLFFLSAEVNPNEQKTPQGDGGPFEAHGEVVAMHITEILQAIENGQIIDSHTEIGIRRFYDIISRDAKNDWI